MAFVKVQDEGLNVAADIVGKGKLDVQDGIVLESVKAVLTAASSRIMIWQLIR